MSTVNPLDAWAPPSARPEPHQLEPGHRGRIVVTIDVPEGCHLQSAQPAEPFLIPTSVELEAPDGVTIGEAVYPPAEHEHYEWTPVVLSIYRGTVEVVVPVEVATGVPPGPLSIVGRVRFQGCTEYTCLPPVELPVEVDLSIVPPDGPASS
jgi:DsbC/DsbD-like thiol-disulfide interchange protein